MSRTDAQAVNRPTQDEPPRMWAWGLICIVLMSLAQFAQTSWPDGVLPVVLYKAHLAMLAGWLGYWLDRALFPYDRPHQYLEDVPPDDTARSQHQCLDNQVLAAVQVTAATFGHAMIRRALIVLGCLVCVGLGA